MNKAIIFCASFLLLSTSVYAQTTVSEDLLTSKELERKEKMERIAKERNEETNRFKRKAIERAEARERHQSEIQKERAQRASRFQKEAMQKDAQDAKEEVFSNNNAEKSRFTLKAEERAAKRAQREQEILERKNRRQN